MVKMTADTDTASGMLISLSDIALLARVQRPVVSTWRRRPAPSGDRFPSPAVSQAGHQLFDAAEVVDWLEATGRGNNPEARIDLAAFAALRIAPLGEPAVLVGVTALLCLLATHGALPANADDLLDLADERDPDDELLYAELDALGDRLAPLARYAALLASAAFSPAAAFEKLMTDRFRLPMDGHVQTDLTPAARDLVVSVAVALGTQAELGDTVFVDPTTGGSDLIIDLTRRTRELGPVAVATPDGDNWAARLLRRRLRVHDVVRERLPDDGQGGFLFPTRAVIVAQVPSADEPTMSDAGVLQALDHIALGCTHDQRVVVLGPASALTDRALPPDQGPGRPPRDLDRSSEVTRLRRDLLKTDLVRAVVRLPAGLVTTRPRQHLALWCLGPAPETEHGHGSLTLVAHLANQALDASTMDALVADIVAGLQGRRGMAAHSLQLSRAVATSSLQLSDDDLVSPAALAGRPAVDLDRLTTLAGALRSAPPPFSPPDFVPRRPSSRPGVTTVTAALQAGALQMLPGLRLDDELTAEPAGVPVVAAADLLDEQPRTVRRITPLALAARYPTSRLTEPGDVVFCTASRPAAWVDREGGSVVAFPAKVLRCRDSRLVPAVVAADINAQPAHAKAWRAWTLRSVPADQAAALARAVDEIDRHRADLQDRLVALDQLSAALVAGTADGSLDLTDGEGN